MSSVTRCCSPIPSTCPVTFCFAGPLFPGSPLKSFGKTASYSPAPRLRITRRNSAVLLPSSSRRTEPPRLGGSSQLIFQDLLICLRFFFWPCCDLRAIPGRVACREGFGHVLFMALCSPHPLQLLLPIACPGTAWPRLPSLVSSASSSSASPRLSGAVPVTRRSLGSFPSSLFGPGFKAGGKTLGFGHRSLPRGCASFPRSF